MLAEFTNYLINNIIGIIVLIILLFYVILNKKIIKKLKSHIIKLRLEIHRIKLGISKEQKHYEEELLDEFEYCLKLKTRFHGAKLFNYGRYPTLQDEKRIDLIKEIIKLIDEGVFPHSIDVDKIIREIF